MTNDKYLLLGADWCPNCPGTKKHLATMGVIFEYVDADGDKGSDLCIEHGVRSLPTLVVQYEDSVLVDVISGQSKIIEYFKEDFSYLGESSKDKEKSE